MRILANYGVKTNGDTYSVTFETMGDVPAAQGPATVDELFRLAREAVQRQISGHSLPQPAAGISVPRPTVPEAPHANGNGKKPAIKDPALPASPKQVTLLKRLAQETHTWVDNLPGLTMGEASEKIDELLALRS